MTKAKSFGLFVLILGWVLFISTRIQLEKSINQTEKVTALYTSSVESYIELDNLFYSCKERLSTIKDSHYAFLESIDFVSNVHATMYNPVPEQTNSEPLITASGANIDFHNASDHNWIAVSRDLHSRWGGPLKFGDLVYISGTTSHDGVYTVYDLMNARFKKRIDILQSVGTPIFKYENVRLYKIPKVSSEGIVNF